LKKKKKIRILSVGTGEKPFKKVESSFDKTIFLSKLGEFMMNVDTYTAHWYLKDQF